MYVFYAGDENDLSTLPDEFSSWEEFYTDQKGKTCLRTSYNTYKGEHKQGGTAFRGNYAGKNGVYDPEHDIFFPPKNLRKHRRQEILAIKFGISTFEKNGKTHTALV